MVKCKLCKEELFEGENCFGNKKMEYICCNCFENMSEEKRKGIIPVTRSIMTQQWKDYVHKFGLKT